MKTKFNKLCFLTVILIFIISLTITIYFALSNKTISFTSNCSKPFSKDLWESCSCINDCKLALVCEEVNGSSKCMNVMTDYIKERALSV